MQIVFIIISAAVIAFVFVDILQVNHWFKGLLNFKPFNCQVCLSGWVGLGLSLAAGVTWWAVVPVMCLAMVTNIILSSQMNKV